MDLVEAYPMHEEEGAKIWLSEHPEVNEFFLHSQKSRKIEL